MFLTLCILLLFAGPWLGPAWSTPALELDHQKETQILPGHGLQQESVERTRPGDGGSGGGDHADGGIPGECPDVPRQYPVQTAKVCGYADPTRQLLISVQTSSFL